MKHDQNSLPDAVSRILALAVRRRRSRRQASDLPSVGQLSQGEPTDSKSNKVSANDLHPNKDCAMAPNRMEGS